MSEFLARLRAVLHDRYRVERELGRGGMATVWLAEDLKNHRSVALKVLRPEIACALTAERFVRETRVTARLTHPNILPLFDSGEQGGFLYYVMPYVAGETLRQRLDREHQLPLDVAIRITCEVADALDYAHRHGVVHRDIKPENILLEEGHAIVADFGVARAITAATTQGDKLTDAGLAVGTLQYMSPEQASGGRDIDERADIYGLGCVLYEMLAGVPPFQGSVESVLRQHITASPPPLSTYRAGIAPRIERAIAKALAKSPAERWRSGAALCAAVSGGGAAAYRVLVRRKVAAAVAITLAVIGTAAMVGRLLRAQPPNSVAVLYFANLSDDSADVYLADGLTEEIIARLGEMNRFPVKSRTALAALPGKSRSDPASIGRTLGVTHIVNGSVRRARSRLRVTVELVHARSGAHLWGAQFDRPDSDLLDVEESIAAAVAGQVEGQLAPARRQTRETHVSRDPVAYDHYLRGNHYLAQRTARGVELAIDEYDIAARRDPRFIEALARQAYGYALFLYYGWPYRRISPESLLALGRGRADQALRADSNVAEAWLARGRMLEVVNPVTYEGAIAAYRRASALDPQDPEIFNMLGASLRELGDDSGATRAFYQALRLDPDRATTLTLLGIQDALVAQYDSALHWVDSALAVDAGFYDAYVSRGFYRLLRGDTAGARADAQVARQLPSGNHLSDETLAVLIDARSGRVAPARQRLDRLMTSFASPNIPPSPLVATLLARALQAVGDRDRALDVLERAAPRGAVLWFWLRFPGFDPIRADPRFQRVIAESRPPLTS